MKLFQSAPWLRAALPVLLATLMTACGGGGSGDSAPVTPPVSPPIVQPVPDNTLALTVDAGPAGGGRNINLLYASVTVCQPNSTSQCKTIDHVLVDTGSTGLRLLSSALDNAVVLNPILSSGSLPLLNCAQFVDGSYAWGPVVSADVVLGSKVARGVPIQIIADPVYAAAAGQCAAGNSAIDTASSLGANGILGVGLFLQDCGTGCVSTTGNGYYYTCTDSNCRTSKGVAVPLSGQLANPVALFAADNNGLSIRLPAVSLPGVNQLSGSLVFGINTQSNNQFTSGSLLVTDSVGLITTVFAGKTLSNSFIDTGSNGLYFDTSTLTACTLSSQMYGFYCPSSTTELSATLSGKNAVSANVSFSVSNAQTLVIGTDLTALPSLAGQMGSRTVFDWGLPFFYGRSVFFGFDQKSSPLGIGPLIAF